MKILLPHFHTIQTYLFYIPYILYMLKINCISCKNNYKLQDYAQCFKEWLKQKSINDKRCSDLYFKIPESYNPTEA